MMKGFLKGDKLRKPLELTKRLSSDGIYHYEDLSGNQYDLDSVVITESDELLVLNYHSSPINVSHFQGTSRDRLPEFMSVVNEQSKLVLPDNLTVVTTYTDADACILYQQLKRNNIDCINSFDYAVDFDGEWNMTKKIDMILKALDHVDTDYALICDGYDVFINSFDNIIPKFESTGLRMFFNGTKNNFPQTHVDRIPYRDWRGEYRYFNAGCAIGYVNDFKYFYEECSKILPTVSNPWNSEQLVLRSVFARYSEDVDTENKYMDFDWECNIFQTYVNSVVLKLFNNQPIYAVL
jgi:hypothetical protein